MKKINPQKHFLHKLKLQNYSPIGEEENKLYLWRGIAKDSNVNIVFPTLIDKEVQLFNRFFALGRGRKKGFKSMVDEIKKKASTLVSEKLSNKYKDQKFKENDYLEDVRRVKEGYNREVMRIARLKREGEEYDQLEEWDDFSSNSPRRARNMTRTLIPVKSFYELVKQYFDNGFTDYQMEYFVDRLKDVMYAQWWFDKIDLRMIRTYSKYITTSPSYSDRPSFTISSSTEKGKKIEIDSSQLKTLLVVNVKVTYIEPLVINYKLIFNPKGILTIKCNLIYKQSDATNFNYPFNLKFGEFENNYETKINLKQDNLYRESGDDRTFYKVKEEGVLYPLRKKLFGLDEYNVPIVSWSTAPFVLFNRALFLAYPYNEREFYKLQSKASSYPKKELSDDEKSLYAEYTKNREIYSTTTDIPFGKYKNFWKNLIKRWFGKSISDQFYIGKELDENGKPKKYGVGFVIVPNTEEAKKYYYMMFDKHSIENWEKKAKEKNIPRLQGMGLYQFSENDDLSHYITSYFAPIYVDALSQAMLNDNKFSIGKTWYIPNKSKRRDFLTLPEDMQKFRNTYYEYERWINSKEFIDSNNREYYVRELVLMNENGFLSKNEFNLLISRLNRKDLRTRNNPRRYKYMSLDEIEPFESLMDKKKVSLVARGLTPSKQTNTGFLVAYKRAKGDIPTIEQMKNGFGDQTWGERRHGFVARHAEQMKNERAFDENGDPTRRHLGLIAWAYTPFPKKIKDWISKNKRNFKTNPSKSIKTTVHRLSEKGVHEILGYITISEDEFGIIFDVDVTGIPQGEHGFHVHEYGNLSPKEKNNKMVAGLSAGSHFDPLGAGFHGHPEGHGHLGDLPKLTSDKNGVIKQVVRQDRIKSLDMIKGRSLVIHRYGDNYSDFPLANGGGKSRYAGSIIENSCRYCEKRNNPKKKKKGMRDEQGLFIPEKYYRGYKGEELEKRIKEIGDRRKLYKKIIKRAEKEKRKLTKDEYQLIYGDFETDKNFKPIKSQYTLEAMKRGIVGTLEAKRDRASEYYGGEIPLDMLEHIYKKGMGAWSSGGHRGGATKHEWAMARVNSFLVGGKTFFHPSADKKQAEELPKNVYNAIKKQAVWSVKLNKIVRKNPQSYPNAKLIYGRAMAEKDWYRPLYHYDYYYHVPKKNNLINTDKLLDSIDKDIYEIVRIAHEKGLSTNSSCQGHFFTIKELKEKYKKAKEDEKQIRDFGLVLENVETGEHILWQQSDYKFPYTQQKYIEIMRKKPRGYLPIYLHEKNCGVCHKLDDKGIPYHFDEKEGLLEFHIDEKNKIEQTSLWNDITNVFGEYYDE